MIAARPLIAFPAARRSPAPARPAAASLPEPPVIDLKAQAEALRVAADDALADAGRTDYLAHLCRQHADDGLRGRADANRRYAEALDGAAVFLARCAAIPGLPAMVEAMAHGAVFAPSEPVPVVGWRERTARAVARVQDAGGGLRRALQRGAA